MTDIDLLHSDFANKHPDAFAKVLGKGQVSEVAAILKSLHPATAASIVSRLPTSQVRALLASGRIAGERWLSDAPMDDAIALLSHLPRENSLALVNAIPDGERKRKFLRYLRYPAHSLGSLVADLPVRFVSDEPAADVLAELRSTGGNFPGLVAIVNRDGRYLGTLNLWALLVTKPLDGPISDFLRRTPALHPETSLISAVKLSDWHRNNLLPVVDHEQHLLGSVSRERVFAIAAERDVAAMPMGGLFASLFADVMRLFGQLLDQVFGRKATS